MKLDKIDEVRNSAKLLFKWWVCCHPKILLPYQRDVTTSPLYCSRLRFQHLTCQFPSRVLYMSIHSPLAKETGFPEVSGIRGFRIRNTAQVIRNPTNDRNWESKFYWQRILEFGAWKSGIHCVESRILDFLGFPCMGRIHSHWCTNKLFRIKIYKFCTR